MAATKQITLRMPLDLLEQLESVPKGQSAAYIVNAVRERLAADRQARIDQGLKSLAFDYDANDLSWATEAQQEVMARLD